MPLDFSQINPGFILIMAGLIATFVRIPILRAILTIGTPIAGLILLLQASMFGVDRGVFEVMGFELVTYRVDSLSFIFGLAFLIAALLYAIYTLHEKDWLQDSMGLIYAGASVGAAFCGDLLTLFVFWEVTAVSSVFLIWRMGTMASYKGGMRYLAIQVLSGVLLLFGAVFVYQNHGDLGIRRLTLDENGAWLLLVAFGIKAAFPFMHTWLQDAYPRSTPGGAVIMTAMTTKLAVYALARVFPGTELLIYVGAIMTIYPVFFAVVENDLRKVLAFSTNNQIGFMVCAVGVGTPLALNGAAAHAFVHVFFKGLLFMTMGAVLHRTGTTKASELGGLWRTMPMTTVFCIIGAVSISAFPLFSGFVAKSMTMSAVATAGYVLPWCALLFASAGVLEHSGIKIPYFAFFAHDSGKRPKEAPFNMLLAMGAAAFICVAVGLPYLGGVGWLYSILPYAEEAHHYQLHSLWTVDHVITQLQLLIMAMFAFILLQKLKLYPPEKPGTILDFDWVFRKPGYGLALWADHVWARVGPATTGAWQRIGSGLQDRLIFAFSPEGQLSRGGLSGSSAVWTAIILGLVIVVSIISAL